MMIDLRAWEADIDYWVFSSQKRDYHPKLQTPFSSQINVQTFPPLL